MQAHCSPFCSTLLALILAALPFTPQTTQAQSAQPVVQSAGTGELPMPKQLRRAYAKGTRAMSGAPGAKYAEHAIRYELDATLDPDRRTLTGTGRVTFTNNGPDTLRTLVLKLIQNMYRGDAIHAMELAPDALTEGMRVTRLAIDGREALSARELAGLPDTTAGSAYAIGGGGLAPGQRLKRMGTVWLLRLPAPLAPAQTFTMEIDWNFDIPNAERFPHRMGSFSDTSFFIGSWYPKIAMHDDIRGWDLAPYDNWHEFYHAFADYTVRVTVPARFNVWCTGELANARDVLTPDVLARYERSRRVDTVVAVLTPADRAAQRARTGSAHAPRTWIFTAAHVPDVAFAASASHLWDATSIEVAPGRRVHCSAVRRDGADGFLVAAAEARTTIDHLSRRMPGIPYPFPAITVFHGIEGMEYPMIVNDGDFGHRVTDVYVHSHEISHQYFPFYVGTDEYRHAWMDESMAYFLPIDVQRELSNYDHRLRAVATYSRFAGGEADYPLMIPTHASVGDDFMILCYQKAAVAFDLLRATLGAETFDRALRTFITEWAGRHPTPWDFFHTFDRVAGSSLAWFWKPWFFDTGAVPDLAIAASEQTSTGHRVTIRRIGAMPVPVELEVTYKDGRKETLRREATVWREGAGELTVDITGEAPVAKLRLGSPLIPDADPTNNQ